MLRDVDLKKQMYGMALVEILVTAFIIAGSLIAYASLSVSLMRSTALTEQQLSALNLANSKIEYFRSFETLNTTTGKFAYADIVSGSDIPPTSAGDSTTYTRTWTVTDFPNASNSSAPAYKVVDVIVSWTDTTNISRSIELISIIAQSDPANSGNVIG